MEAKIILLIQLIQTLDETVIALHDQLPDLSTLDGIESEGRKLTLYNVIDDYPFLQNKFISAELRNRLGDKPNNSLFKVTLAAKWDVLTATLSIHNVEEISRISSDWTK